MSNCINHSDFIKIKNKYKSTKKTFNQGENGKSIVVEFTDSRFHQIHIDKNEELPLVNGNQQIRCDFLLIEDSKFNPIWLFLELKGSDINDANEQIINVYNNFKSYVGNNKYAGIVMRTDGRKSKKRNINKPRTSKITLEKYGFTVFKGKDFLRLKCEKNKVIQLYK